MVRFLRFQFDTVVDLFQRLLQSTFRSRYRMSSEEVLYLVVKLRIAKSTSHSHQVSGRIVAAQLLGDFLPVLTNEVPPETFTGWVIHNPSQRGGHVLVANLGGHGEL